MKHAGPVRLALVVPCYNEEAMLPETLRQLASLLDALVAAGFATPCSRAWLVDDGSRDNTWELIAEAADTGPFVGLKLSRNQGHQAALLAGLLACEGDAVISLDADLQDDLGVVPEMLMAFREGAEVVYGVRGNRDSDTVFKRGTARLFYRVMTWLGVDLVPDHADYRLLGRRAIEALRDFREINLFLRGIVPRLGFPSARVYYARQPRLAGESKYPLRRMLAFALDGVTAFSAAPLRVITAIGFLIFLASSLASLWILYVVLATDHAVPGWASTALPLYLLGGVQLLCLGVIGEYVGRIYGEVKSRPRFIIEHDTRAPGSS